MSKKITFRETLVVVGVIVLFTAMLATVHAQVFSGSKEAVCRGNMHNVGIALAIMRGDFNDKWSMGRSVGDEEKGIVHAANCQMLGFLMLMGYVDDAEIFTCPAFKSPHGKYEVKMAFNDVKKNASGCVFPADRYRGDWSKDKDYATDSCGLVQHNYFYDEYRIPENPDARRVVMADGIEFVSSAGPEPACHANGANMLFVDMAVLWQARISPDALWGMDVRLAGDAENWKPGEAHTGGQAAAQILEGAGKGWSNGFYGSYGWGGADDKDHDFSATNTDGWYRYGWLPNPRLNEDDSCKAIENEGEWTVVDEEDMDDVYLCEGESPRQDETARPETRWQTQRAEPAITGAGGVNGWNKFYGLRPHGRTEKPYGDKTGPGCSKRDAAVAGGALHHAMGKAYRAAGRWGGEKTWYDQEGHGDYEGWAWGHPGKFIAQEEAE